MQANTRSCTNDNCHTRFSRRTCRQQRRVHRISFSHGVQRRHRLRDAGQRTNVDKLGNITALRRTCGACGSQHLRQAMPCLRKQRCGKHRQKSHLRRLRSNIHVFAQKHGLDKQLFCQRQGIKPPNIHKKTTPM